jgi:hypothetical protein
MDTSTLSPPTARPEQHLDPETREFYCRALTLLQQSGVSFLVGGAYAFERYTGIARHTKDLDIFVRAADCPRALAALEANGCHGELPFPHWLAKAYCGDHFVDLIFGSGNGIAPVDDVWFAFAVDETVLGVPVRIVPAEEMIWQKALIMERERFDGADVAHLLRARADQIDWDRLIPRFGDHWPVLLSHLILFGYIYPEEQGKIPATVTGLLLDRQQQRLAASAGQPASVEEPATTGADDQADADGPVCQGTVLSRTQYVVDIDEWGYQDARLEPRGRMTPDEAAHWTAAGLEQSRAAQSAG